MRWGNLGALAAALVSPTYALRYDPAQVAYNLNTNQTAVNPIDYSGKWDNHTYHPSPSNWRFPFYTLFLDRFVNGDPGNGKNPLHGKPRGTSSLTSSKMMPTVLLSNMTLWEPSYGTGATSWV